VLWLIRGCGMEIVGWWVWCAGHAVVLWEVAGGVDRADCVSTPVWIAVCSRIGGGFRPSADKLAWAQARTISEHHRLALPVLLLCTSSWGFFPPHHDHDVVRQITAHVRRLNFRCRDPGRDRPPR
jgi:hypothetical protein